MFLTWQGNWRKAAMLLELIAAKYELYLIGITSQCFVNISQVASSGVKERADIVEYAQKH